MGWDVGGGSFVSFSISSAVDVVRWRASRRASWRASWSLVLLAMLWSPSSEDCTSVPPSEGDTSSVKRLVKKQNLAVT